MPETEKNSASEPGGHAAGLWTTANVARDLGVAVEVIESLRVKHCTEAGDTTEARGLTIFCEPGLEKIRRAVSAGMAETPGAASPAPVSPAPAAPTLPTEDLTITRIFRGSPRVLANLPNGNEVVLQVKTAELLKIGMVLRDCQHGGMGWYYHGRLPRVIGEQQLYFPAPIIIKRPAVRAQRGGNAT